VEEEENLLVDDVLIKSAPWDIYLTLTLT